MSLLYLTDIWIKLKEEPESDSVKVAPRSRDMMKFTYELVNNQISIWFRAQLMEHSFRQ